MSSEQPFRPPQGEDPVEEAATPRRPKRRRVTWTAPHDEQTPSPHTSGDEQTEAWGEKTERGYSDDWYLSQRPPHHD